MSKLNKKFVTEEWIPALRSGEYKQTQGYLHDNQGYCCLGVACDLLMKKGLLPDWEVATNTEENESYYEIPNPICLYGDRYTLPRIAVDYLGVRGSTAYFDEIREQFGENNLEDYSLAALNDEEGLSFEEIADFLEGVVTKQEAA